MKNGSDSGKDRVNGQKQLGLMDKPERKVKSVSVILPVTRFWRGRDGKIHFIVRRDR